MSHAGRDPNESVTANRRDRPLLVSADGIGESPVNRADALDKANALVSEWITTPPMKANGYPIDGWKAPTLKERTEAVKQLADFLWEIEPEPPVNKLVPPRTTLFGWPVDGMDGPPSIGQYRAAREVQRAWRADPNGIHRVDEIEALNRLIEAYEEAAPQAGPPAEPYETL